MDMFFYALIAETHHTLKLISKQIVYIDCIKCRKYACSKVNFFALNLLFAFKVFVDCESTMNLTALETDKLANHVFILIDSCIYNLKLIFRLNPLTFCYR